METAHHPDDQKRLRLRRFAILSGIILVVIGVLAVVAAIAGYFDRDPIRYYPSSNPHPPIVAVFLSGDMGTRWGIGSYVAPALSARNIPVFTVNSPSAFGRRRTQGYIDALIVRTARAALARTGAQRLVLIGQSFGSDMITSSLRAIPPDLRAKIASVILVVPGERIYFRADASEIAYLGKPDVKGDAAIRAAPWAPITCIYGAKEDHSLCPLIGSARATLIELPGGHTLHHDPARLLRAIFLSLSPLLSSHSSGVQK
tara:strand:+ start:22 stop:795 length:774 start_codon:yes stop_codon:yes gene_type:complete